MNPDDARNMNESLERIAACCERIAALADRVQSKIDADEARERKWESEKE